jgi:phosphinothricin acetyltransferase
VRPEDVTWRIRTAEEADLPRVVEIYNSAVPARMATADTEPVTIASRQDWFRAHDARTPLWTLEAEGRMLGWLSLSAFYGRPAYAATKEVSVYVDAAAQRGGVASRLLAHALAAAPGLGVSTLLGFVFSHNTPSLVLFGKFGFERWGELPRVAVLDGVERGLSILGRRV